MHISELKHTKICGGIAARDIRIVDVYMVEISVWLPRVSILSARDKLGLTWSSFDRRSSGLVGTCFCLTRTATATPTSVKNRIGFWEAFAFTSASNVDITTGIVEPDCVHVKFSMNETKARVLTDRNARLARTTAPFLSVSFDLDDSSTISSKRAIEPTSALNARLVGKFSFCLTQIVYIP
jgi:hypothetical protein